MAFTILPSVPKTGKGKSGVVRKAESEWLFCFRIELLPLVEKLAGMMQRRFLKGSRQVGAVGTVSALALIVEMPLILETSLVKKGLKPQRMRTISREPFSRLSRMTDWKVDAATL